MFIKEYRTCPSTWEEELFSLRETKVSMPTASLEIPGRLEPHWTFLKTLIPQVLAKVGKENDTLCFQGRSRKVRQLDMSVF
jgi:hypothetical protein